MVAIIGFLSTLLSSIIGAFATIKAAQLNSEAKGRLTNPTPINQTQTSHMVTNPSEEASRKLIKTTILIMVSILLSMCCCISLVWLYGDAIFEQLGF